MVKRATKIDQTLTEKREQLEALRSDIEDLSDYLDVLEARANDLGKRRLSHDEVRQRYGLKPQATSRPRNGRKAA